MNEPGAFDASDFVGARHGWADGFDRFRRETDERFERLDLLLAALRLGGSESLG